MSERNRTLYGTSEAADVEMELQAGPLSARLVGAALRDIRWLGVEVIRNIAFLVRDRNWATVEPAIEALRTDTSDERFAVQFRCRGVTASDNQELTWEIEITGSPTDGVVLRARATPDSEFATCRTGFVVLHPLEGTVGCPVTVEHSDGRIEETRFPDLVDPLQSFMDIRALTHEPLPGVRATCRMQGGVWEMEDHRNWLDASFKTYFRPLALPWPYSLPAGQALSQEVSVTFSTSAAPFIASAADTIVAIAVGDRTGHAMPMIGVATDAADLEAALRVAESVAAIGVQSLSVRLRSDTPDLPGRLRLGSELAARLGSEPVLELILSPLNAPTEALDLVAIAAASAGFRPAALMVSPAVDLASYPPSVDRPAGPALAAIYAAARAAFPDVRLGGGMFRYFTELNRRRPPAHLLDFVQHATSAIVHAADDRSVMETLESLPHVIRSMRAIAGATPYWIGPANIGMPFNPYGASSTPNPDRRRRTMAAADPRQTALFGAAWAAGYLARAAQGGVGRVTLMAPSGPCGVVAEDGAAYPAMHVLQGFADLAGAATLQSASSMPQQVLTMAAAQGARRILWIANVTPRTQRIALSGMPRARSFVLDERAPTAWAERSHVQNGTIELGAFAVLRAEA